MRDPTVYVSASCATDPGEAPADGENWFVLVNAPSGVEADWEAEADRVVARLGVGDRVVARRVRSPADLERETGAVGGAIYGDAPHGRLGTLRRPGPRVRAARNVVRVGGTAHPGGGLPLALLSGALACARSARVSACAALAPAPGQPAGRAVALRHGRRALVVAAALGNSPWTVLADGVHRQAGLSIGTATILISLVVLLGWVALRQRPGAGDGLQRRRRGRRDRRHARGRRARPDAPVARVALLLAGIALVGVGSGFYLGAALGPGPRDGLMTGLHARTGRPVFALRTGIELTALVLGVLLGGAAGVGTVAFALLIGPAVHAALRVAAPARAG